MNKLLPLIPLALIGCTTMSIVPSSTALLNQRDIVNPSISLAGGGFNAEEAQQLLEFCIELNNQDDRNNPDKPDPKGDFKAHPNDWKIVYDSRHPDNTEWNRKWAYTTAEKDAKKKDPNDPETNGFGPLNNAWLLVQSTKEPSHFAIAIRGTVSEWRSILADAYATTTPAYAGIEYPKDNPLPITFAATPEAELHLGFAYATLSLLFEDDRGILAQLHKIKKNQDISKLFITGHSQGAAIATLVHSFLYYAITDSADRYELNLKLDGADAKNQETGKPVQLKSYLFAQPKPGNLQYAQDFARITKDMAFVINNDRDPVPQVPLSLETVSEVAQYVEEDNVKVGGLLDHMAEAITHSKNLIRDGIAGIFTDHMAEKFVNANIDKSIEKYFSVSDEKPIISLANSLNYTLAGQLIPVFGYKAGEGSYPIDSDPDILLQHHATSYRQLIDKQLKPPLDTKKQ